MKTGNTQNQRERKKHENALFFLIDSRFANDGVGLGRKVVIECGIFRALPLLILLLNKNDTQLR